MVRSKAPAKKQQKKGIDFKKIKRKLGRKLPPAKNATNTEIKSKAITLPEQSVGAEKSGLATSRKGLTLKELLQQTSHHNSKVRKDALTGIKDLLKHNPTELQSHKYAIIQKLRERISDDDKSVRETFFLLFETVIFPACLDDNQGPMVSLLMPYIFSAMADSAIDVRLMAFKFLHLVVKDYYPATFSLHAEKILDNYKDIIQKNQFYVQEKSKLRVALSGLEHCLSLLPCDESDAELQRKGVIENETLLGYEEDVTKECVWFGNVSGRLKDIVGVLINCFQDFIPLIHAPRGFDSDSFGCLKDILCSIRSAVKFSIRRHVERERIWVPSSEEVTLMILDHDIASMLLKKLLGSFPLNPENNLSGKGDERYFILNSVLTEVFLEVNEWSYLPIDLCNRFLEFIENTLLGKIIRVSKIVHQETLLALLRFIPRLILRVDRVWRDNILKAFTFTFNNCKPESSLKLACISIVRDMIIPNGDTVYHNDPNVNNYQNAWINQLPSLLNQLGDNEKHHLSTKAVLQLLLDLGRVGCLNLSPEFENDIRNFFNPYPREDDESVGPFASLPRESQELSLCFLYYYTIDNFTSPLLESIVSCCLYPKLEPAVLFRIVEILHTSYRAGYIEITDHFSFLASLISRFEVVQGNDDQETRRHTYKELTNLACSCLSQMGDGSLIVHILENVLLQQITLKPSLDNGCGILRMICVLDSKPTILSESSITTLSEFLPKYLIHIVTCIPENKEDPYLYNQTCLYYLIPCYFLFDRSSKLTEHVLKRMQSIVSENAKALESEQDRENGPKSLSLIKSTVSVVLMMHNDDKVRKIISSSKSEIDLILQNVVSLESSGSRSLTVEEKHKMKIAGERLKICIQ